MWENLRNRLNTRYNEKVREIIYIRLFHLVEDKIHSKFQRNSDFPSKRRTSLNETNYQLGNLNSMNKS